MDTSMYTQKPCSGGTIELNHTMYISTTNPLKTLMASVYLSLISDKQPEFHCITA
jgi:hypothetical protein